MIDEAYGLSTNSPDKILEACYDYWALSQIAKDLGNEKIAQEFEELTLERQSSETWTSGWSAAAQYFLHRPFTGRGAHVLRHFAVLSHGSLDALTGGYDQFAFVIIFR